MDHRIITANQNHLDSILRIEQVCFPRQPFDRAIFLDTLASETAEIRLLLAEDSRALGFCLALWANEVALGVIGDIAVLPLYRGRGLASRLLADAESLLLSKGKIFVTLEVRISNPDAIRLYEKQGYHCHQRIMNYYGDGEDAYRYIKFLNHHV